MKDSDWNMLIQRITTGNCVLVLGPELATEEVNGESITWHDVLADKLANELEDKKELVDRENLAHVAQKFCIEQSHADLEAFVMSFYMGRIDRTCEIHEALSTLPFHLIINATQNDLFETALKKADKQYLVSHYNYQGETRGIAPTGTPQKPLVYYLYGWVKEPNSLVISENDLLDYLVAVISRDPPIHDNIRSEFRDPDKCFLFLGFGFNNWYLRILLHVLQGGNRKSRSFAFEQFTHDKDTNFREATIFFKDEYKIYFDKTSPNEFAGQLRHKYIELASAMPKDTGSSEELLTTAPNVFICHASEDKEDAQDLCDKLRAAGLNAWLDRDKIGGGDDWDVLIEKTIATIDYFIVMQSKALIEKKVGYVNKEINLAIERQKRHRYGIRFIIPVSIESDVKLGELNSLQTIDLTNPEGIERLLSDIKRDQQRR